VYFARATGSIVGTCRRILRPLHSHNYNCTKDYADNDKDSDDDVDDADADADAAAAAVVVVAAVVVAVVVVVVVDKDAGYGARTSWSPWRQVLAVKGGRVCAPMLCIPIHAADCAAAIIARIFVGPVAASFGITSWPCPVCLES